MLRCKGILRGEVSSLCRDELLTHCKFCDWDWVIGNIQGSGYIMGVGSRMTTVVVALKEEIVIK